MEGKREAEQVSVFVSKYKEKAALNQYWYSPKTIEVIVKEVELVAKKVAFLSTPSIYFSLSDAAIKKESYVFDLDTQFACGSNFVQYDFNKPTDIPTSLWHSFDCVVIDPPFITADVWKKYGATVTALLRPQGKIILTSTHENAELLHSLFAVTPQLFSPSVPHLVYQYRLYCNYPSTFFSEPNPEIGD
ncbi:nucleic acid binding protein [Klebsormidium nitens]|uniref:Nucleic acid binding protein n=1 Tax=Klebsormidium nitens TaxID=105231 RepID=A0A1Y1IDY9_KLENI|nr:nucleic acid binding protein [Klebsormidium nitens]|eukprot:GAQ87321.1 nucleic acid binding protein [Klebsormidium nitens]